MECRGGKGLNKPGGSRSSNCELLENLSLSLSEKNGIITDGELDVLKGTG
jgi:hypothetical protein